MPRLTALPRPFIVCVVTDRTIEAAVATMRLAQLDGAHAYEINLPALAGDDEMRLSEAIAAVDGPVYVSCRRREFMRVYGMRGDSVPNWSDEVRMRRQLEAATLGASAIDIELDSFDPQPAPPLGTPAADAFGATEGPPAELTVDPGAVVRQRATAADAKRAGAEVIFSCHTGRPQAIDSLREIAGHAVERGADLIKIVTPCQTRAHLYDLLEATARLHAELPVPFTLVGAGPAGQLSRVIGANFGSAWLLGQQTLTPGGFHPQPLVSQLRETIRLMPWKASGEAACA